MSKKNIFTRAKKKRALELFNNNQLEEALELFNKIVKMDPRDAESWSTLSAIHGILNNPEKALQCAEKSVSISPKSDDAWFNLANAQRVCGQQDKALLSYQKSLKIQPAHLGSLCNAGGICFKAGDYKQSQKYFEMAAQLDSQLSLIPYNLGKVYNALGLYEKAIGSYLKTLRLKPNHIDCQNNLARLSLLTGDFENGWKYYKKRLSLREQDSIQPPDSSLPENLNNKRIYITKDQGLGDEIFFLRFIHKLKEKGAWISYLPDKKIKSILSRVNEIDYICEQGEIPDNIDIKFSIGDLPLLLDIDTPEKITPPLKLSPLKDNLEKVRNILEKSGPPPYIGVTWRAGTNTDLLLFKEAPLKEFLSLLNKIQGTVVILQRQPDSDEIETIKSSLGINVCDCSDMNNKLEDMLALLNILDEYIGVSNTNIHLRAGLKKRCKVLAPFPPEWRWMAAGQQSHWFPDISIYRQDSERSWESAFKNIKSDLEI